MASRLIIDGNTVYEIDEDCVEKKYNGCGPLTRQSVEEQKKKPAKGKKRVQEK